MIPQNTSTVNKQIHTNGATVSKDAIKQAMLKLYDLGANVLPIPYGQKEPQGKWEIHINRRQTRRQVDSFKIRDTLDYYNGQEYLPIETIAIINGINGWISIDIDALVGEDGNKIPVNDFIVQAILVALGVPNDYPWIGRSKSGAGIHIWLRCNDELNYTIDHKGVVIFIPNERCNPSLQVFDHIELRLCNNITVLPSIKGYNGSLPSEPPKLVSGSAIESMLKSLATIKPKNNTKHNTKNRAPNVSGDTESPFDRYNREANAETVLGLLQEIHWTEVGRDSEKIYVRRPGSTNDTSGNIRISDALFYCHTTNGDPFDANMAYSPAMVYATIKFKSDYRAAARKLANEYTNSLDVNYSHVELVRSALLEWEYDFKRNVMNNKIEINGEDLDDFMLARVENRLDARGIRNSARIMRALREISDDNAYHPIVEYFDNLVWDGKDHIAKLASYFKTDDPTLGGRTSFHVFFRRFVISVVSKIYRHTQTVMFVLQGDQGIGKSHLARWLCEGLGLKYYSQMPLKSGKDPDDLIHLTEKLIWELDELDVITRKADLSTLKAFITTGRVDMRHPYDKFKISMFPTACLIGTVNNLQFLIDNTGNRRFWVTSLEDIDHSYSLDIDPNQIWAQAKELFLQGESYTLTQEEQDYQTPLAQQHKVDNPLENALYQILEVTHNHYDKILSRDIIARLKLEGLHPSGNERAVAMEISELIRKWSGVKVKRTAPGNQYSGLQLKPLEGCVLK